MATLAQFNQDPNQQQTAPGGGGQILNSTGASNAAGVSPATPAGSRPPLTGAPNIQQYLQANQGAGQRLAGGIQGNVQQQANQLQSNVNTYGQQLQSQSEPLSQTEQQGSGVIKTAFQDPQSLLNAYQANQANQASPYGQQQNVDQNALQSYNQFQALNNPNAAGGLNQQISAYGNQAGQDVNQLRQQYSGLQQQAGQAATETGRAALLRNTVGQPNYSMGQQGLDALFLQAQPGVVNQLQQNLGQIANTQAQNISGLDTATQNRLAALQNLSAQNQQAIQGQFGGELGKIAGNVQQEYNQLATSVPQQQEAIKQGILNNNITPAQLQQLGLSPGMHTYGLKGQDILNSVTMNPLAKFAEGGAAQAAGADEFARYNALQKLAGSNLPTGQQQSIFGAATQTGFNPITVNQPALQAAIQQQKSNVLSDMKSALQNTFANFNMNPYTGSGMQAAPGGVSVPIAQQLAAGVQAGTLTPEQAQQIIMSGTANLANQYGDQSYFLKDFQPFEQYYTTEYQPDTTATLGASNLMTGGPMVRK